ESLGRDKTARDRTAAAGTRRIGADADLGLHAAAIDAQLMRHDINKQRAETGADVLAAAQHFHVAVGVDVDGDRRLAGAVAPVARADAESALEGAIPRA